MATFAEKGALSYGYPMVILRLSYGEVSGLDQVWPSYGPTMVGVGLAMVGRWFGDGLSCWGKKRRHVVCVTAFRREKNC